MRAHRWCQECYRYGEAALLGVTRRSLTRLIRPPGKADIDWAFVMPSPVLWAIRGEETDLKIMLNIHNIHYIMSHLTAFLILLKLLRNVDGLKEFSISSSSSTRFVSMHFSGQFAGLLSKIYVPGLNSIFINLNFSRLYLICGKRFCLSLSIFL